MNFLAFFFYGLDIDVKKQSNELIILVQKRRRNKANVNSLPSQQNKILVGCCFTFLHVQPIIHVNVNS
jgi:hypothetical protein